jgi:hypothetical protein
MLQCTTAFARVGTINHVRSPNLFSFMKKKSVAFRIANVARGMPHLLAAIPSSLRVPSVPDGLATQAIVLALFGEI